VALGEALSEVTAADNEAFVSTVTLRAMSERARFRPQERAVDGTTSQVAGSFFAQARLTAGPVREVLEFRQSTEEGE
jgi:hypothetical protein